MRRYPDLLIRKYVGGNPTWWEVAEPVLCHDQDGSAYIIPAGFISNFASMPLLAYLFIAPHGKSAIPSVKHDYRYVEVVGLAEFGSGTARKNADDQYLVDLIESGLWKPVAQVMYGYVRMLGWYKWNQHLKNKLIRMLKEQENATA